MTQEQQTFDYDIAVSFAGEQREYVKGVVRGLGDDLSVFYDEDEKATMLGENLIDFLTDIYQHKARYVAMFVSEAYARKMWTNVERQSAMARAVAQRSVYILPIRMDDTDLPGLLPTVGYADARNEGLDGIISLLREKLGRQRVAATYTGRVPQTQADLDLLLALRPDFWEWWLYAGTLKAGLPKLEGKYRDYDMGFAKGSGIAYHDREAFDFLRSAPTIASSFMDQLNSVLNAEVQAPAFGEPGEPGDPERIIHLAQRLLDIYEGMMDEASRLRSASLPVEFKRAQQAAAKFGVQPIERIRQFVTEFEETVERLPELADADADADDEDQEPLVISMTLDFELDDALLQEFTDGLEEGVRSLTDR